MSSFKKFKSVYSDGSHQLLPTQRICGARIAVSATRLGLFANTMTIAATVVNKRMSNDLLTMPFRQKQYLCYIPHRVLPCTRTVPVKSNAKIKQCWKYNPRRYFARPCNGLQLFETSFASTTSVLIGRSIITISGQTVVSHSAELRNRKLTSLSERHRPS